MKEAKEALLIILVFLFPLSAFCQGGEPIDIQYIELKDSVLVKEIENLIKYEETREIAPPGPLELAYSRNLFKEGIGYISVRMESYIPDYDRVTDKGDTMRGYYIEPSWYVFREETLDVAYPPFYTYVGGKIVLLHFPVLEDVARIRYTEESKEAFRKKVDEYLEEPQKVDLPSENGQPRIKDDNFRISYFRPFRDGWYVYILWKRPPIVMKPGDEGYDEGYD